jgi:hypothetical protein
MVVAQFFLKYINFRKLRFENKKSSTYFDLLLVFGYTETKKAADKSTAFQQLTKK